MLCNLFLICRESLGTASSMQWSVARKPKGGIMRGLYQGLIQLQGTSGKVIGHVRPRGWHLPEAHILIDGEPATGCLVDFGLYFYHNYAAFRRTRGAGFGPFLYLTKMEHSREAKIWNFVFEKTQKIAGIERGSIRATVLILDELRDHSVGLIVEDGITSSAMPRHSRLTQIACYQTGRGLHAMGGMAAQIPIRDDTEANNVVLKKAKERFEQDMMEHGRLAAHPGLIPACMEVFSNNMGNTPDQIHSMKREDASTITEEDLLQRPGGSRSLEAWLTGTGSVPLYNLMEDAATAEISRVQNWQWLEFRVELDGDGLRVKVNVDLIGKVVEEEMARIEREIGKEKFKKGMYREACRIFTGRRTAPALDDFLTLNAYNNIDIHHPMGSSSL
ncbi:hypothetical protein POTOM_042178 [Populus tomentosa]|uniref:Malate synthase n=1 Tax=Populus tomentosa TaxID=118781 RepID=A0A8X7YJX3_POPTO|nr:hypothetical protein POTOM_042178 [Populus tomentosa]